MKSITQKKAERLYTTGKIKFISAKNMIVRFMVYGDTERHTVEYNRWTKRWSCVPCPAYEHKMLCSHVKACQLMIEHEKEAIGL